jgi:hypothetical protein
MKRKYFLFFIAGVCLAVAVAWMILHRDGVDPNCVAMVNGKKLTQADFDNLLFRTRALFPALPQRLRDQKIIDLWIDSQLVASSKNLLKDTREKNVKFEDIDTGTGVNFSANTAGGWAPALADLARRRTQNEKRNESYRRELEKNRRDAKIWINPKYR